MQKQLNCSTRPGLPGAGRPTQRLHQQLQEGQVHTLPSAPNTRALCAGSCACAASTSAAAAPEGEFEAFKQAAGKHNLVPLYTRIAGDQLTPVTAYRRLVSADDREAPSYLFESVQNGTDTGRYSFVGAHPALEVLAKENTVTILDHEAVRCLRPHGVLRGGHPRVVGMHKASC